MLGPGAIAMVKATSANPIQFAVSGMNSLCSDACAGAREKAKEAVEDS
jgi:hypothetical protein